MRTLWQDLRFGARMLLKKPSFTLIAVITLALGIGANTAIFSVVYAVLLRPLPFPEQERLVVAWKKDTTTNNPFVELAVAEVRDWQEQNRSFTSLALMPTTVYGYGYTLTDRGDPLQLESAKVTGRFFSVLGAQAALGRVFDESEDQVNGAKVVVLGDQLWRERFSADPKIIGRTITLSQQGFTVIGVMPPTFAFPKGVDLWTPLLPSMDKRGVESRGYTFLQAVGRLKPGVTLDQAEADLNTIIARLAEQYPATEAKGHRVVLTPLPDYLFGDAKPALWTLYAATGLLLLIAAANIANLSLARATSRRKELAVRAAMGASRWRLVGQLLCESFALAICGGAAGVSLAYWLLDLLVAIAPADIPRLEDVRISGAALLVSLLCTLATTLVFGLLPALSASRFNLNETLNDASAKLSGSRAGNRLRVALVVGEVALTLVLLVGATLILRSFLNLSRAPLGFDPSDVLTMQLRLTGAKYGPVEARREFFRQLIERLEALPGVVAASGVLIRPLEGLVGWDTDFAFDGQSPDDARRNPKANYETIYPHYFRVFGIPLKAGREFDSHDKSDGQKVAIVNETTATRFFGSATNAVGKRINVGLGGWMTIVGVAGDVRYRELQNTRVDIYVPYAQSGPALNHFAVRTTLGAANALALVRREVAALDPQQAVSRVATMDELVATQLARPRFSAVLLNWLSGLAVSLAAVGIFGVMAYSVAQRSAEIGVRIALGAQGSDILKLIIGQGMRLVAIGVGIGLTASFALTRLTSKLLFGVSATDPLTFTVIALSLTVVALLACYIPARRATKVDPMIALRTE
ncbi:MAG TPA: ABC transporter permease [Blastocatellia bacterium]|jgi:putative ABC transport system permease protein|nr:ABC transporter permease [Blastocatellia bacterium]